MEAPPYPLGEYDRENIRSKTGKRVDEITLDAVTRGQINAEDIKISSDILNKQGQIAEANGKKQLADNFMRASEMVNVPDDVLLNFYNKLRPNRSTKNELLEIAELLQNKYRAPHCAKLVMDAIEIYEKRGILL